MPRIAIAMPPPIRYFLFILNSFHHCKSEKGSKEYPKKQNGNQLHINYMLHIHVTWVLLTSIPDRFEAVIDRNLAATYDISPIHYSPGCGSTYLYVT